MAPISQYRIASEANEIALARSAAPASISEGAEILVLGERGYDVAVKGTNGFVCLVAGLGTIISITPSSGTRRHAAPNLESHSRAFGSPPASHAHQMGLGRRIQD